MNSNILQYIMQQIEKVGIMTRLAFSVNKVFFGKSLTKMNLKNCSEQGWNCLAKIYRTHYETWYKIILHVTYLNPNQVHTTFTVKPLI